MSFAYLRLYTGDYLRDTQHLSCAEHGCYLKLLMYCWDQKGPAPLDERKLMGICNARSTDELEALRRVLSEFFTRMEDGYYNHRMQDEVVAAQHYSDNRSAAGRKSAEVRTVLRTNKQVLNKSSTSVEHMSVASASTPASTTVVDNSVLNRRVEVRAPQKNRGSRLPDDWQPSPQDIEFCKAHGFSPSAIADSFRDYWHSKAGEMARKVDWSATWRSWIRKESIK